MRTLFVTWRTILSHWNWYFHNHHHPLLPKTIPANPTHTHKDKQKSVLILINLINFFVNSSTWGNGQDHIWAKKLQILKYIFSSYLLLNHLLLSISKKGKRWGMKNTSLSPIFWHHLLGSLNLLSLSYPITVRILDNIRVFYKIDDKIKKNVTIVAGLQLLLCADVHVCIGKSF